MNVERIPPFRIVVADDVWRRRTLVCVEPRQCDKPSRSFRDPVDALAYAEALHRIEGWPIEDRRGDG